MTWEKWQRRLFFVLKPYMLDQLILCLWLYVTFHIIHKNDLSNLRPSAAWSARHYHTSDFFSVLCSILSIIKQFFIFAEKHFFLFIFLMWLWLSRFNCFLCRYDVLCVKILYQNNFLVPSSSVYNNLNINHFVFKQHQPEQRHVRKFSLTEEKL